MLKFKRISVLPPSRARRGLGPASCQRYPEMSSFLADESGHDEEVAENLATLAAVAADEPGQKRKRSSALVAVQKAFVQR